MPNWICNPNKEHCRTEDRDKDKRVMFRDTVSIEAKVVDFRMDNWNYGTEIQLEIIPGVYCWIPENCCDENNNTGKEEE